MVGTPRVTNHQVDCINISMHLSELERACRKSADESGMLRRLAGRRWGAPAPRGGLVTNGTRCSTDSSWAPLAQYRSHGHQRSELTRAKYIELLIGKFNNLTASVNI